MDTMRQPAQATVGIKGMSTILRSSSDMLHFACSTEHFPLTLTLSLREREQQASDWCLAGDRWANSGTSVLERGWIMLLPLPRGEGRAEGEASVAHPLVQSVEVLVICANLLKPAFASSWRVAQAFQPAGSGDFRVASPRSVGLESPENR